MNELSQLKDAVLASDQTTIFNSKHIVQNINEACVAYLRFYGYKVTPPNKFDVKIDSIDDLIYHFYSLLNNNTDGYATSFNLARDRAIAKRFVEARVATTGASKAYVLEECGEIVNTIFANKEEFINPKYPFDFGIFGNNKMKWLTDKAIKIMNKKLRDKHEEDAEVLRQKALDNYKDEAGFGDLDDILKRMEEEKDG